MEVRIIIFSRVESYQVLQTCMLLYILRKASFQKPSNYSSRRKRKTLLDRLSVTLNFSSRECAAKLRLRHDQEYICLKPKQTTVLI